MKKNKNKNLIMNKKNAGSTMIETLVSFTVLFAVLASLYAIVTFSSELYMRSVDISRLQQRFYREMYKKDSASNSLITKTSYVAGNGVSEGGFEENHAGVVLILDTENTKPENYHDRSVYTTLDISMDHIKMDSYVWNEQPQDGQTEVTQIVPKAVVYEYVDSSPSNP